MMMPSSNWMNNWSMPSMMGMDTMMPWMMPKKNEAEMRNMPVRPSNWMECWSMSEPIKCDMFGNRCFWLNLDMHLFKPEEIKVSFDKTKKCVCIEATCEEKCDPKATSPMSEWSLLCASKGSCKRTYSREFFLPEECKIENLKCNLSFDGWLCFECPIPSMTTMTGPMPTPVSVSNMSPMSYYNYMMSTCPSTMPSSKGYLKTMTNRIDTIPVNVNVKN